MKVLKNIGKTERKRLTEIGSRHWMVQAFRNIDIKEENKRITLSFGRKCGRRGKAYYKGEKN